MIYKFFIMLLQLIFKGEVAICAEHIDPNVRWHPACFCCTKCQRPLVDLLYYNIGKEIYCEKHFKEKSLKKFSSSNENIYGTNKFEIRDDTRALKSKQNVYHSFKQPNQIEKTPLIACAGCDMV